MYRRDQVTRWAIDRVDPHVSWDIVTRRRRGAVSATAGRWQATRRQVYIYNTDIQMLLLGRLDRSNTPAWLDQATSAVLSIPYPFSSYPMTPTSTLSHTHCLRRSCWPRSHAHASGELSLAPYLLVSRRPWPPEWGWWRAAFNKPTHLPSLPTLSSSRVVTSMYLEIGTTAWFRQGRWREI